MARSTQLGECVAAVLGIKPTTAASHVRNLREARLLTKTGRGVTGAHMTTLDAARVLIACTCSQDVQDSAETVQRYANLPHIGRAWSEEFFPAMAKLGDQHLFRDALASLLSGESIDFLADDPQTTVFVTFTHPIPTVSLEVATHGWEREQSYDIPWLQKPKPTKHAHYGDRQIRYRFTEQTIYAVGSLLRG
jgi:hypothetical protein